MTGGTRPPWCGNPGCDPSTRMIEVGEDRVPRRCPCASRSSIQEQLAYHQEQVRRLLAEIAAQDAAEWVRGPGARPP